MTTATVRRHGVKSEARETESAIVDDVRRCERGPSALELCRGDAARGEQKPKHFECDKTGQRGLSGCEAQKASWSGPPKKLRVNSALDQKSVESCRAQQPSEGRADVNLAIL